VKTAVIVVLTLALLGGAAHGQSSLAPTTPTAGPSPSAGPTAGASPTASPIAGATPPKWYGWQILISDAAVAGTWVGADAKGSEGLAVLGALGYFLGAPIIHGEQGRLTAAYGSLGLRLGAPLIGALVGLLIGTAACPTPAMPDQEVSISACDARGAEVGFFGTMIAVSIFDIARATKTSGEVQWRPDRGRGFAWAPVVAPTSSGTSFGTSFGLVGRF
jgi:hypothetical protein